MLRMGYLDGLTVEAKNHVINREEKSLWAYIGVNLFEIPREESVLDMFAGLEGILLSRTATKGHGFIGIESYSLDTTDILKDIETFSGLVANEYFATLDESEKRLITKDYVSKLITRFVFDQVNFVYDEGEFGDILTYNLFLELPSILNARTKPTSGGLLGMLFPIERDSSEFKPSLRDPIGASIYNLKKRALYLKEKTNELRRTNQESLRAFLFQRNPDLIKYEKFKNDERVNGIIEKLDEKVETLLESRGSSSDKQEQINDIVNIVENIYLSYSKLSYSAFTKLTKNINSKLKRFSSSSWQELVKKLKRATKIQTNYDLEINGGNSIVEKFSNPEYIKKRLRQGIIEHGDKYSAKKFAFSSVLIEMRGCAGFCDNVYIPLANMLLAQNNENDADYSSLSFAYAFYINRGGSVNVIEGLEEEPVETKKALLDVLDYNQKHKIVHMQTYERILKEQLLGAHDKNAFLEEEKKRLEKERITIEIQGI